MRNINLYVLYLLLPVFIFGFAIGRDYQYRTERWDKTLMRHTIIFQSCYIDHWWPDSLDVEGAELKKLYDDLPRRRRETERRMKDRMYGL